MTAPDPALVAAVLAEEWSADSFGIHFGRTWNADHERRRQTVLAHRLLRWAAEEHVRCRAPDCPVCALVAELRPRRGTAGWDVSLTYKPVNRRWLMDTIGPWWLILAIGTMGMFVVAETLIYEAIDWHRERQTLRKDAR